MAHIVGAWELGGHLGHLGHFAALVPHLQRAGHRVSLIARDLSRCLRFPELREASLYQAPIWLPRSASAPNPPASFTDILAHYGFLSTAGLHAMVKAWRSLFHALAPDLVLYDHAPTALLASRGLPFSRATLGTGFTVPPSTNPLPAFRQGQDGPSADPADCGTRVLRTANRVLELESMPPLNHIGELFDADESFLCTLPPLDHYTRPPATRYWGLLANSGSGLKPDWKEDDRPRVFAYVKPPGGAFDNLLQGLADNHLQAEVFAPGVADSIIQAHGGSDIRIGRHPYDLDAVLSTCDAVICHAGHNTLAASLLAGKPVLAVPQQWEQGRLAEKTQRAGLGIKVAAEDKADLPGNLQALLTDSALQRNAKRFASEHADLGPEHSTPRIAHRCGILATGHP